MIRKLRMRRCRLVRRAGRRRRQVEVEVRLLGISFLHLPDSTLAEAVELLELASTSQDLQQQALANIHAVFLP